MLKPDEASLRIGVPVAQLLRWAWIRQGPKNSGTRTKPLYDEGDLERWLAVRSHPGERLAS